MAVDDALADLQTALGSQKQPAVSYSFAPPPPQTGVDAALADLGKTPEQLRAEIPAPPPSSGVTANFGAGGNEMLSRILGAPVDVMTGLLNLRSSFANAANAGKRDVAPVAPITNPVGGGPSIESAMGLVGADPRNIVAGNEVDRLARAAGAGAVGMAAPYLAGRAMIAGGLDSGYPGAVARAFGGPAPADAGALRTTLGAAGNAAVGTTAGAAGQGAEDLLPENSPWRPLANFAGQMLGGGLVAGGMGAARSGMNYGAGLARDTLGPMRLPIVERLTGNQLDRIAANRLFAASSDPYALAERLDVANPELVAGSRPTTPQLTGDQGIGRLQATLPQEPFQARAAEQNAARVGALQNVAPAGNSGAVRDLLQQRLDQIDAQGDTAVQAARQNAQQALEGAGGRLNPEDYGAAMRGQLEAAKAATKAQESALWQQIDPEGKLTINAVPVRDAATQIAAEIPKTARPPEGEERAVFGLAQMLGTGAKFSDFTALRGRLLQAIRDERENGQTPALRRMQQLRSAMDDAISNAAVDAAQAEPASALVDRLSQRTGDLYGRASEAASAVPTGGRSGADYGVNPGIGPQQGPGLPGTTGQTGGGSGGAPGYPGLPGAPQAEPLTGAPAPFDAAAAARYRAAADATRERAATFNNPVIGPALAERGGAYRVAESRLPERFLSSPEGVQAFLAGGGDRATLADALVGDLRRTATKADGTLDTSKFQSWQMRRAPALRALPELQQSLGTAAQAQDAVDAVAAAARRESLGYQRGAARYFLNAEPMQAAQSALNGRNPVGDLRELSRLVGGDADAKAGLQRAVADYIAQRTVRAPIGEAEVGTMNARAFGDLMRRNGAALAEVFSPAQMQAMRDLAADLQRSGAPSGGGVAMTPAAGKLSVLTQYLGHGLAGLGGYLMGGFHGAIEGAGGFTMGKTALDAMRRSGVERVDHLLTEALLNPELARTLLMKATPGNRPFIAQRLASQLGTLATTAAAGTAGDERPLPIPAASRNKRAE